MPSRRRLFRIPQALELQEGCIACSVPSSTTRAVDQVSREEIRCMIDLMDGNPGATNEELHSRNKSVTEVHTYF